MTCTFVVKFVQVFWQDNWCWNNLQPRSIKSFRALPKKLVFGLEKMFKINETMPILKHQNCNHGHFQAHLLWTWNCLEHKHPWYLEQIQKRFLFYCHTPKHRTTIHSHLLHAIVNVPECFRNLIFDTFFVQFNQSVGTKNSASSAASHGSLNSLMKLSKIILKLNDFLKSFVGAIVKDKHSYENYWKKGVRRK